MIRKKKRDRVPLWPLLLLPFSLISPVLAEIYSVNIDNNTVIYHDRDWINASATTIVASDIPLEPTATILDLNASTSVVYYSTSIVTATTTATATITVTVTIPTTGHLPSSSTAADVVRQTDAPRLKGIRLPWSHNAPLLLHHVDQGDRGHSPTGSSDPHFADTRNRTSPTPDSKPRNVAAGFVKKLTVAAHPVLVFGSHLSVRNVQQRILDSPVGRWVGGFAFGPFDGFTVVCSANLFPKGWKLDGDSWSTEQGKSVPLH
jgi:hypothetical protein